MKVLERKYSEGKEYKVIAFVLSCFPNAEQSLVIRSVAKECEKLNCKVVFFSTATDFKYDTLVDAGDKAIFSLVPVGKFDAIILMSESFRQDEEQLELVKRANLAGVPIYAIDKCFDGCINVVLDYVGCFKEIVRHMVEYHGYRDIIMIAGIPENTYSQERIDAYREVLEENGIPFDESKVYYGHFWDEPTLAVMEQIFEKVESQGEKVPEAIICANDTMALVALNYVQKKGYRVPEDIAISGFDGIELERFSNPRLTTGIYNLDGLIETIFKRIVEGRTDIPREPICIPNQIRIGCSCGCDGIKTCNTTDEIRSINTEINVLMRYQMELNQMVASFGNSEQVEDIANALPEYMTPLGYKDFWMGFEEALLNMVDISQHFEERNYTVWDRPVGMLHYHKEENGNVSKTWGTLMQSELILERDKFFEGTDCYMVNVFHINGVKLGYTVVGFDYKEFYFLAYNPFLANLRNLLQLQQSQRKIIYNYERDQLTGLYNRNGFYKKIVNFFKNSEKNLCVIFIDMDGLKGINDTYGHAEGDIALQNISKVIDAGGRDEIVARIGGDEFVIAYSCEPESCNVEKRKSLIIQGLAAYNQTSTKPYALRASIGVFSDYILGHTIDYFLKNADSMMYIEKTRHKKELENNK